jgi:hypothetical protein
MKHVVRIARDVNDAKHKETSSGERSSSAEVGRGLVTDPGPNVFNLTVFLADDLWIDGIDFLVFLVRLITPPLSYMTRYSCTTIYPS